MKARRHPLVWLPPMAVGGAAAVAGELSVALLLYTTEGFLEALTVILVVELGALSAGLWSAPTRGGPAWEAVRRRWLLALVAFTAAACMAAGWDLIGGLAGRGVLRGLGLALLAAFPLYAAGTLLGVMSALGRDDRAPSAVAAPAVAGAAAGAALVGTLGARLPPVTAYLGCVALLSAASLVHGRTLDRLTRTRTLAARATASGRVRVGERARGARRERVLLDGDLLRGGHDEAGRPVRAWEEGAARLLEAEGTPMRLLVVGAGAAGLAGLLPPGCAVTVAEPDPDVAALVAEHLPELATEDLRPCDLLEGVLPGGAWDAAVVDASAWMGRSPVPRLPRGTLEAFARSLEGNALLLLGGVRLGATEGCDPGLDLLAAAASEAGFPSLEAYAHEDREADGIVALRGSPAGGPPGGAFRRTAAPLGWRLLRAEP